MALDEHTAGVWRLDAWCCPVLGLDDVCGSSRLPDERHGTRAAQEDLGQSAQHRHSSTRTTSLDALTTA